MESQKNIVLGYGILFYKSFENATDSQKLEFLSWTINPYGRLLLVLMQYLQQFTKYFDRIDLVMVYGRNILWSNGTLEGLIKKINSTEVDVGLPPLNMQAYFAEAVDFTYPYPLEYYTFLTLKPKYKPHIFGIFQTLSLSVWLTVLFVFIVMLAVCYVILKKKYSFDNISFNVFAILMK